MICMQQLPVFRACTHLSGCIVASKTVALYLQLQVCKEDGPGIKAKLLSQLSSEFPQPTDS